MCDFSRPRKKHWHGLRSEKTIDTDGGQKMEESDREILIGENRIYLGEDNILYITIVGEINDKIALEFKNTIFELNRRFGKKVRNSFIDINKAGKVSSEARKLFKELSEDTEIGGGKSAIFGLHPVARVIASFFIGISSHKHNRFFKTTEEALAWLKMEE